MERIAVSKSVKQLVAEGRFRLYEMPEKLIADMFNWWVRLPEFGVEVPVVEAIPETATVYRVHHGVISQRFEFLVVDESFEPVAEGYEPPRVICASSDFVTVLPRHWANDQKGNEPADR